MAHVAVSKGRLPSVTLKGKVHSGIMTRNPETREGQRTFGEAQCLRRVFALDRKHLQLLRTESARFACF